MPAFMFEKISAPEQPSIPPVVIREPRGVIVQLIDRLAESRFQREARKTKIGTGYTEADITPQRTRGK